MWIVSVVSFGLAILWFVLTVLLHKGGYVHMFLIAAISIFGVQLAGYRKTQYHKRLAEQEDKGKLN